jgi:hypothetical protein
MRRIEKNPTSLVLEEQLTYPKGGNPRINELLLDEQNRICAYTEEYLGRSDSPEVEHFNPLLKFTDADGYENWFLVKARWNLEKGGKARWLKFQPLLHPTAPEFNNRVLYEAGAYKAADMDDVEARNLINYLKLNDEELIKERINYIDRLKEDIAIWGLSSQEFLNIRLANPKYRNTIIYIRAIETELDITVNFDLINTK